MRALLCIVFTLCLYSSYSQELLKVEVQTAPKEVAVSWKDSVNVLIKAYDSVRNYVNLQQLLEFFEREDVQADTVFMRLADTLITLLDSVKKNPQFQLPLFGQMDGVITQKPETTSKSCPEMEKVVSIVMSKTADAEFEVTFTDKKDNPLAGFVVRQLNEALFYDKVQQSLYGLCDKGSPAKTDAERVKNLIADFKKKSLYQHMLEAGLEVNDDDVYAGKLTIRKKVTVTKEFKTDRPENPNTPVEQTNRRSNGKNPAGVLFTPIANLNGQADRATAMQLLPNKRSLLNTGLLYSAPVEENNFIDVEAIKRKVKKEETTTLTVYKIQIQFQDGFIENIKVRGKIPGSDLLLKFENSYPIPFSTRRDFRKLYDTHLEERTVFANIKKNKEKISRIKLRLGDLLDFDQNLELDSKDYSPVNQVVEKEIKDDETVVNLLKERTSKILELKVFTDLKGIEDDNPNGLVQLELAKKLNFWNMRGRSVFNLFNYGFFNYFTPSFAMTKIENNNKRLPINYVGSQEPDVERPNNYASTLQLLQYQAFRVGADISVITLDVPGLKSTITGKTGFYFGRTLIVDTVRRKTDSLRFDPINDNNIREDGVNSFQFIPEICLQIFPDKRYGVLLSYKLNRYRLLNSQLKQVNDTLGYVHYINSLKGDRSGINRYPVNKWLATAEVFAFYRPSVYNQLFFRYRFNYQRNSPKINFHQIQLGFATYLTHTSKGKKEKATEKN